VGGGGGVLGMAEVRVRVRGGSWRRRSAAYVRDLLAVEIGE